VSPPNAGVTYLLRSARELSQLLDGFLLTTPCGLISSRRHSWGSRLQGFSLLGSRTASLRPLPSGRWASEPTVAFRALLTREIRRHRPACDRATPRSPLGFYSSRVLRPLAVGTPSRALLPWALDRRLAVTCDLALRSITSEKPGGSLPRLPTLVESFHLMPPKRLSVTLGSGPFRFLLHGVWTGFT
jgi:hypothetical protein